MNGLAASAAEVSALGSLMTDDQLKRADILICPPATLISTIAQAANSLPIDVGGQDCHASEAGANTGDVSAEMLADAGASYVIVGHSERRRDHGETNDVVRSKAIAAHRAGLIPIVCIGENLDVREAGKAATTVLAQLEASLPGGDGTFVVAYEPNWAIGTGVAATPADIDEMHRLLRSAVGSDIRLLYGGSVKAANAAEIFACSDVDGALVGGASLKATDFHGIIAAA